MEGSSSSSPFFGMREEKIQNQIKHQAVTINSSTQAPPPPPPPSKKRRNQPGTPNPDAEVIALSPKTLMATNRFICEVCNKGFKREQNLQLHRRGHNLPWKLRQKSTKEVKRRVYLCPEPTCVHHDPSRALGDLTGIKKHFCRKHGEKKWKCDKCSKRYAVQSDWKAHSKTCGTREYRCDCGTLFSRRDSFITHRAFCDALAQESTRLPAGFTSIGTHLYGSSNNIGLGLSQVNSQIALHDPNQHTSTDLLRLGGTSTAAGPQFNHLMQPSNIPPLLRQSQHPGPSSGFFLGGTSQGLDGDMPFHHGLMQSLDNHVSAPSMAASQAAATFFNLSFFSNTNTPTTTINNSNANIQNANLMITDQFNNGGSTGTGSTDQPNHLFSGNLIGDNIGTSHGGVSSIYNTQLPSESILPQMSATALLQKAAQMGSTMTIDDGQSMIGGFGSSSSTTNPRPTNRSYFDNEENFQDLMNSLANGNTDIFGVGHNDRRRQQQQDTTRYGGFNPNLPITGVPENLTRDFLGVGGIVRNLGRGMMTQIEHQHQHHHGSIDLDSLDPETKTVVNSSRSYAGGSWQ